MARHREFGEGPIYTITNYIFWFLGGSLYFGLCSILFLFVFLTPQANPDASYLIVAIISLIPTGPAITALMSVMGKLVREKDARLTKDYLKAYKQGFKQSMIIWLLELGALSILIIDVLFFKKQSYGIFVIPIMYVIGIIILVMGLYAFPLIARFRLKTKDIIRLSFYYSIVKVKINIFNITALIIGGFALYKYTSIAVFFVSSGVCYLIMFYEKDILKELEDQIESNKEHVEDFEEVNDITNRIFSDKIKHEDK